MRTLGLRGVTLRGTALCAAWLVTAGCERGQAPPERPATGVDGADTAAPPPASAPGAPGAEPGQDALIVADMRIGPVDRTTSERELIQRLGAERVLRREAHIGEGFCVPGSALYPGTADEIEVLWSDTTYADPAVARVAGAGSRWRTGSGVQVGTRLFELEETLGRPIELSGFGWDYGGGSSWTEPGSAGGTIALDLAPHPDSMAAASSDPRYGEILGDKIVRSDHPLMERLDVRVERISVRFGRPMTEHACALP